MFDKKKLCIGAEIEDTGHMVSSMARDNQTVNHGLISQEDFVPLLPGYYHTTVVDLNEGQICTLAAHFDELIFLDQDKSKYPHFKTFLKTCRLFKYLESNHVVSVRYKDNENIKQFEYWWNYLRKNRSFCFQPFLSLVPQTETTTICPKSMEPIKAPADILDWKTDPDYRALRDPMLRGDLLDKKYCKNCYDKESRGIESARQFETLEWALRMDLETPEDFDNIVDPVFVEIRPSNKCNLMCRMCDDARSHLIEKERKKLHIPLTPYRFRDLSFDRINFDTIQRIYVGGGEPTIMPEFYDFLKKCISLGKVDFELCIGTNGMKFSTRLLDLLSNFSDVVLSFSFDGYGKVNDYIRWGSDFDTVRKNALLLRSLGHKIGLQNVPSIWNVTRLHEVYEFFDNEFPGCTALVQAAEGHGGIYLPWNHPNVDMVLKSAERCKKTNQYHMSGRSLQSYVDTIYQTYSNPDYKCDLSLLKKFFDYNDTLDRSRGSRLIDYIPELEECRKLVL